MEISDVRRRVTETIERAKREASARRTRGDEASREYATFLDQTAVPIFRQVANVLKVQGYLFTVFTPGGSVRLMSDKSADDFIELTLDTSGDEPAVMGLASRSRGQRVIKTEHPIASSGVRNLTDGDVLDFLLRALEPLVER